MGGNSGCVDVVRTSEVVGRLEVIEFVDVDMCVEEVASTLEVVMWLDIDSVEVDMCVEVRGTLEAVMELYDVL